MNTHEYIDRLNPVTAKWLLLLFTLAFCLLSMRVGRLEPAQVMLFALVTFVQVTGLIGDGVVWWRSRSRPVDGTELTNDPSRTIRVRSVLFNVQTVAVEIFAAVIVIYSLADGITKFSNLTPALCACVIAFVARRMRVFSILNRNKNLPTEPK